MSWVPRRSTHSGTSRNRAVHLCNVNKTERGCTDKHKEFPASAPTSRWRRCRYSSQDDEGDYSAIAASTHESKQDAATDVGMSNVVSASAPLQRGQVMTKQAVAQKPGSRGEATGAVRSELLAGAQDLPQGLAMGVFASSAFSRRWTCEVQACTSTGEGAEQLHNNDRLHKTCRPVNQFEHVCVEKCPLTTRHTAAAATAAKSRND